MGFSTLYVTQKLEVMVLVSSSFNQELSVLNVLVSSQNIGE